MKTKYMLLFMILIALLIAVSVWNLLMGSISFPLSKIAAVLFGGGTEEAASRVIWNIRFPRLFAAVLLGGALSVSGFLLQTFFGNPIAGPYVLGISSGAKLAVAAAMIVSLKNSVVLNSVALVAASFAGALCATGFVLLISQKVQNMSMLIVCGILTGYICSAATDFFVTFASDANIVNLHNWSLGSFSGTNWNEVRLMAFIVLAVCAVVFFLSKPIGAYQLGENYARNMGVNIRLLRVLLILLSSLLSACVTAFAGPVSFVGIAVPHLIKTAFGTAKPLVIIPGCFLGGAVITLLCDGIARTVFAPTELSISTVTAFFLVPVVIYMMIRKQGRRPNA